MSQEKPPATADVLPAFAFSPFRVQVLTANTFTQLVRMKTFYFLILFAVVIILISTVDLFYTPIQQVLTIKRWSFGGMYVFAIVYSIAATSLLLPRDLEDRTLYTILSKPVPRFEYLLGRLLGVISVIGLSLLIMFTIMAVLVQIQMPEVKQEYISQLQQQSGGESLNQNDIQGALDVAASQGVTLSLFWALWAVFLKASIISAVTLLISTVASTSLFTIITSAMVVFIGHFHKLAFDYWLAKGAGAGAELLARVLVIVFPDLSLYDVADEIMTGTPLPMGHALEMTALGIMYLAIYSFVAQLIFVDKEL